MAYRYETHLHTEQGSKCGRAPGRDYIAKYADLGFAGIMVTDHFYHGNCRPDHRLPWRQWVEEYASGYEDALEAGEKRGVQVFFGLEERFDWDEWLVYGLDKAYLLAHPDMRFWTRAEWLRNVHAAGGCVIQCHPFRHRDYINSIMPCTGVDGVEICNAGNEPEMDAMAARYAQRLGCFTSAGSDIHHPDDRQGERVFGVSFEQRLGSVQDYVRAVLSNAPHGLVIPAGRDTPCIDVPITMPAPMTVLGADGLPTGQGVADIF